MVINVRVVVASNVIREGHIITGAVKYAGMGKALRLTPYSMA